MRLFRFRQAILFVSGCFMAASVWHYEYEVGSGVYQHIYALITLAIMLPAAFLSGSVGRLRGIILIILFLMCLGWGVIFSLALDIIESDWSIRQYLLAWPLAIFGFLLPNGVHSGADEGEVSKHSMSSLSLMHFLPPLLLSFVSLFAVVFAPVFLSRERDPVFEAFLNRVEADGRAEQYRADSSGPVSCPANATSMRQMADEVFRSYFRGVAVQADAFGPPPHTPIVNRALLACLACVDEDRRTLQGQQLYDEARRSQQLGELACNDVAERYYGADLNSIFGK